MPNQSRPEKGINVELHTDAAVNSAILDCIEKLSTESERVRNAIFPTVDYASVRFDTSRVSEVQRGISEVGFFPEISGEACSPPEMANVCKRKAKSRMLLQRWFYKRVEEAFADAAEEGFVFWVRSLAKGYAMQYLNHGDQDRRCLSFAMGLLSDVGVLVSLTVGATRGKGSGAEFSPASATQFKKESYSEIGYAALSIWGFPDLIRLAARQSAGPNEVNSKFREWQKSYYRALAVSSFVVDQFSSDARVRSRGMTIKETFFVERDAFEYAVAAIERDLALPEFANLKN